MKTNAPEKIYLNPLLMEDGESIVRRCTFERQRDSQIEYTRTDAFIGKALRWMISKGGVNDVLSREMIEDFKNYMKGE